MEELSRFILRVVCLTDSDEQVILNIAHYDRDHLRAGIASCGNWVKQAQLQLWRLSR